MNAQIDTAVASVREKEKDAKIVRLKAELTALTEHRTEMGKRDRRGKEKGEEGKGSRRRYKKKTCKRTKTPVIGFWEMALAHTHL